MLNVSIRQTRDGKVFMASCSFDSHMLGTTPTGVALKAGLEALVASINSSDLGSPEEETSEPEDKKAAGAKSDPRVKSTSTGSAFLNITGATSAEPEQKSAVPSIQVEPGTTKRNKGEANSAKSKKEEASTETKEGGTPDQPESAEKTSTAENATPAAGEAPPEGGGE